MRRRMNPLLIVCALACLGSLRLTAQDLENLQIHGFATQGFIFSSHNNYLTMNSSAGSFQWTEGALSVSDKVTDKLRVGIQVHMYQMGEFGGPNLMVDWASGDYRVNDKLGFRAGKVKVPFGLYNDSQDVDSLFLWVLLPQSLYPDDNRDYDLAELGGEVYGNLRLENAGRLQYSGHLGSTRLDDKGGYMRMLAESGFTFPDPPSGKVFGGDLRWVAPWPGLVLGASAASYSLDGVGPEGQFHMPQSLGWVAYAQWDWRRLHLAGEYYRQPFDLMFLTAEGNLASPQDSRAWYPMVRLDVTKKLQLGTYYSVGLNKAGDTSLPINYSKDWVISSRYDFSAHFYSKLEGHFINGTGGGFYGFNNPNGVNPRTTVLVTKLGFVF